MTTEEGPAPGVDPINEVEPGALPVRPRAIHPSLAMRVRGRTVLLRGIRAQPTGIWRWLAILGPGMLAGAVGNDAGVSRPTARRAPSSATSCSG